MVPQFTRARGLRRTGLEKIQIFQIQIFGMARAHPWLTRQSPATRCEGFQASDQHSRDSFVQWLMIVTAFLCSKHKGDAVRVGPVFLQGPPGRVSLHQHLLRSASSVFTPLVLFCFLSGYHPWRARCVWLFARARRAECLKAWNCRAAVPECQFSFSPNHDMPHSPPPPPPPPIVICPNLPPSLYLSRARS
jgi:hypothetical protein